MWSSRVGIVEVVYSYRLGEMCPFRTSSSRLEAKVRPGSYQSLIECSWPAEDGICLRVYSGCEPSLAARRSAASPIVSSVQRSADMLRLLIVVGESR
jgi:hypothetical protein